MSDLPWLNPTPHAITVYASRPLSPVATQHSLPSGRYPLLGPDFHRPDRTSLRLVHSLDHLVGTGEVGGTVRPSALAVLRLSTRSYLVGGCTGSPSRWPREQGSPTAQRVCRRRQHRFHIDAGVHVAECPPPAKMIMSAQHGQKCASVGTIIRAAASISARWENACGKFPRCLPVSGSYSSA